MDGLANLSIRNMYVLTVSSAETAKVWIVMKKKKKSDKKRDLQGSEAMTVK